jgi:hypothetical protein
MLRRRLLTFAALVAAHTAAWLIVGLFALVYGPDSPAGAVGYLLIIPLVLLGQTADDPPDLGSLVGVPPGSDLWLVLAISVNSVLWVAGACCLWLAGRWAWRNGRPAR